MPPIEGKTLLSSLYEKVMDSTIGTNHHTGLNDSVNGTNWTIDDADAENTEEFQEAKGFHSRPEHHTSKRTSGKTAGPLTGTGQTPGKEDEGRPIGTGGGNRESESAESSGMSPARFSARYLSQRKVSRPVQNQGGRSMSRLDPASAKSSAKSTARSGRSSGKKSSGRSGKTNRCNTAGLNSDDYLDDLQGFGGSEDSEQEDSENEKGMDEIIEELFGKILVHDKSWILFTEAEDDQENTEAPVSKNEEKPGHSESVDREEHEDHDRESHKARTADTHHPQQAYRDFDIHMTTTAKTLRDAETDTPFSFEQVASAIITAGTKKPFQKEVRIRIKDSVLEGTEVSIRKEGPKLIVHFITEAEISFKQLIVHCEYFKSYMRQMLGIGKRKKRKNSFDDVDEIEVEIEKLDELATDPLLKPPGL